MKKTLSIIPLLMVLFLSVLATSAKSQKESAVAVFTVSPQMTCQNCENRIKSNIRFEKGVTDITTDLNGQTVSVTYNPKKTSPEKIINAFKKIGYSATIADPSAVNTGTGCCTRDKKGCCKGDKGDCCKDKQKSCGKSDKKACPKDKNVCPKDKKNCCK